MHFTDLFIRRPVLAIVVSLMILVVGIKSGQSLSVRQYPKTENAVVTVTTTYYGADPDIVAGFITTPLENAIAQASGIDYMTSTSLSGTSTITINLVLNYDADKALTEISTKVNSVLNQLPSGTQQPVMTIQTGQTTDAYYYGFQSETLPLNRVTDYVVRVVQPKIQSVPGVQTAELIGAKNYALRAWLDPKKLAALGVTPTEVSQAMTANDYIAGLGNTKGQMVQVNLTASSNLHTLTEFQNLVIKQANGAIVRLKDVAKVTLGDDDYDSYARVKSKKSVVMGIQVAPDANILTVLAGVRAAFAELEPNYPTGITGELGFDTSDFVNNSINEVVSTLIEATLIVTVVVFAFLGSLRSVIIPVVTIPLSLVGTLIMMLLFGFSINLLTGARDRARGRRCDHRRGEREPAYRQRDEAGPRGDTRRPGTGRTDHRDHAGGRRGVRPDRLSGRADRRVVQRVRFHAGRRRDRLRGDRAHAVADDVLQAAEAARSRQPHMAGSPGRFHRQELRAAAPGL
jgi:multidrug efflux pump